MMPSRVALFVLVALAASACSTANPDRSASRGPLDAKAELADVPVKGFTATLAFTPGALTGGWAGATALQGEVMAVERRGVWLQVGEQPVFIPRGAIQQAKIEVYPSLSGETGVWTALGTVSTLTHGFFLILSAPVWLITGITASVGASMASEVQLGATDLDWMRQYARYPQGLPPSLRKRLGAGAPESPPPQQQPPPPGTPPPPDEGVNPGDQSPPL